MGDSENFSHWELRDICAKLQLPEGAGGGSGARVRFFAAALILIIALVTSEATSLTAQLKILRIFSTSIRVLLTRST